MAPKLIYFGTDHAHRLSVLRATGYVVDNCISASELIPSFTTGAEVLAILCSDRDGEAVLHAVDAIDARCTAPVVIFSDSSALSDGAGCDLVIPNLTSPAEWLQDIASLIEQHRAAPKTGSHSGKAPALDGPPSKIVRIDRAAGELERLAPPPEDSADGLRGGSSPGYILH